VHPDLLAREMASKSAAPTLTPRRLVDDPRLATTTDTDAPLLSWQSAVQK
jgi:hypothetical protein